jgi:hypothetical protein
MNNNPIIQHIRDSIVMPAIEQSKNIYVGYVSKYNKMSNTVDVYLSEGNEVASVPLPSTTPYLYGDDPEPGDKVVLVFPSGIVSPYVSMIYREEDRDFQIGRTITPPSQVYNRGR